MSDSEKLVKWMKEKNFDTTGLAEAVNHSYASIWLMTKGDREVSDSFKWRFSQTFGHEEAQNLFGTTNGNQPAEEPEREAA